MNDTSPEIEAFLKARYAAMTGSERALMALQMFETAQQVVLSSLDPALSESERRRELCRRFYGDELAQAAFPQPLSLAQVQPATYTCPMRIVGTQQRSEIELDPVKAYQRARALDAILRSVTSPIARGVTRGTHAYFNRLDDERQIRAARALNAA